jgi:SAM-dependent methyltransferase
MEREAFTLLHEMENSWWYRGRSAVVRGLLEKRPLESVDVLDFGAGYGGMYAELSRRGNVYAFEPDSDAQKSVKKKPYREVYASAEAALNRRYDLIGLFDVLEHIPDDREFLERARSALGENGRLAITVPAMPFLWSNHDVTHHHYRRYTRKTLRTVLEDAGYAIEYLSYWNMTLFMPAAFMRFIGSSGESSFAMSRTLDSVFYSIVRVETKVMRYVPLPFGVSLVALVRKHG